MKEILCPRTGNIATYNKCSKCEYLLELSATRKTKRAKKWNILTGVICRPPRKQKDLKFKGKDDKILFRCPLAFLGDLA